MQEKENFGACHYQGPSRFKLRNLTKTLNRVSQRASISTRCFCEEGLLNSLRCNHSNHRKSSGLEERKEIKIQILGKKVFHKSRASDLVMCFLH